MKDSSISTKTETYPGPGAVIESAYITLASGPGTYLETAETLSLEDYIKYTGPLVNFDFDDHGTLLGIEIIQIKENPDADST